MAIGRMPGRRQRRKGNGGEPPTVIDWKQRIKDDVITGARQNDKANSFLNTEQYKVSIYSKMFHEGIQTTLKE